MRFLILHSLLLAFLFSPVSAENQPTRASVFESAPRDPQAIYFEKERFGFHADGKTDDSAALQRAIDEIAETSSYGVLFIPEGRYRLAETVHLWRGVRLIGFGAKRPVFLLTERTSGFGEGEEKYMLKFCHKPTGVGNVQDAGNTSYASGIRNIDFKIEEGNPGAIALRYRIPQLCALENMRFDIGQGKGAIKDIGNLIEQCEFEGGDWAIQTRETSAGWQATLLNCAFRNQRSASILTQKVGLTVIGCRFTDTGTGISITHDERLYVKDSRFERLRQAGIESKRHFTREEQQMNLENLGFADVPFSVRLNGSSQGRPHPEIDADFEAPATAFIVDDFSHGIHVASDGARTFGTRMEQRAVEKLPPQIVRDNTTYPPVSTWVNMLDLGAVADGETDCTEAFENAIAKHEVIYLPMGRYLISRPLKLQPQTKLIGLHPFQTELLLKDSTPGFTDPSQPSPMVLTATQGRNQVIGLRFNAARNSGAVALQWRSAESSLATDLLFLRTWENDGKVEQSDSLLVTDEGGGCFKNIWNPETRAVSALKISGTSTPGRVYQLSAEHHHKNEIIIENSANWTFYALQTEAHKGGEDVLPVDIKNSRNMLFANSVFYRTTGVWTPAPTAIQAADVTNLNLNGIWMHGGRPFTFDHSLIDETRNLKIPLRAFSRLSIK